MSVRPLVLCWAALKQSFLLKARLQDQDCCSSDCKALQCLTCLLCKQALIAGKGP